MQRPLLSAGTDVYRMLEAIGSRLLGRLVPRIDVAAACGPMHVKCFGSCWQCDWDYCTAECRDGCGCTNIGCHFWLC